MVASPRRDSRIPRAFGRAAAAGDIITLQRPGWDAYGCQFQALLVVPPTLGNMGRVLRQMLSWSSRVVSWSPRPLASICPVIEGGSRPRASYGGTDSPAARRRLYPFLHRPARAALFLRLRGFRGWPPPRLRLSVPKPPHSAAGQGSWQFRDAGKPVSCWNPSCSIRLVSRVASICSKPLFATKWPCHVALVEGDVERLPPWAPPPPHAH